MEAEDKLKQLYKDQYPEPAISSYEGNGSICVTKVGIFLAAEHVDLIADLVVDRLKKVIGDLNGR